MQLGGESFGEAYGEVVVGGQASELSAEAGGIGLANGAFEQFHGVRE